MTNVFFISLNNYNNKRKNCLLFNKNKKGFGKYIR